MDGKHRGILTEEYILQKFKASSLKDITNINLWGQSLENIDILASMPKLKTVALSVNSIRSLRPFANLTNLTEIFLRKNKISDLQELHYLKGLPNLTVLWLSDNPIVEEPSYRAYTIALLPTLLKLDEADISPQERAAAEKQFPNIEAPSLPAESSPIDCQSAMLSSIEALLPALDEASLASLHTKVTALLSTR